MNKRSILKYSPSSVISISIWTVLISRFCRCSEWVDTSYSSSKPARRQMKACDSKTRNVMKLINSERNLELWTNLSFLLRKLTPQLIDVVPVDQLLVSVIDKETIHVIVLHFEHFHPVPIMIEVGRAITALVQYPGLHDLITLRVSLLEIGHHLIESFLREETCITVGPLAVE